MDTCINLLHVESCKHGYFRAIIILLFFSFIFPLITNQTSTEHTTFSFTHFSSGMREINFQGDTIIVNQTIKLTETWDKLTSDGSVGRATYFNPIHLWNEASGNLADFNTHFSFVINSEGNDTKGSGMTFFLTPNISQLPLSSEGRYLGLSSDRVSSTERPRFVAVEFDTMFSSNLADPVDVDEHIGIDINSVDSSKLVGWSLNDISNGGRIEAWVYYNSSSKNLSVFVTNDNETTRKYSYNLFLIVDLREHLTEWVTLGFSAATSIDFYEKHEIYSWEFSSSLKLDTTLANFTGIGVVVPKRKNKEWLWVFFGIGGTLFLVLVVGLVCFVFWRIKRSMPASCTNKEFENETGPRSFPYEELMVATNNFAEDRILGKGGFGMVYMGFWSDRNSCVAVKKITSESEQGLKAYASEVTTISRLRHRNLVQLLGWCRNKQELLIVYEFVPNKSLDVHLFNKTGLLTWDRRYGVALGLASGLLYLHEECEQCVLHRDIKSSNVLLDSNFNAKLGDFGLAKLVEHGQGSDTTRLIGTVGYVSPEYLEKSKATKESDVYSFGIVALEIASGRPAFKEVDGDNYGMKSKVKLVEWVWQQYQRGNILGAADPQLNQGYVVDEMERLIIVGLACAHPDHSHRLSIREAIDVLNAKAPLPKLPLVMYFQPNTTSCQTNVHVSSGSSSVGASGSTQSSTR